MQWKGHFTFPVGLSVGLVLASMGAALVWLQAPAVPLHDLTVPTERLRTAPTASGILVDNDTVKEEITRLENRALRGERLTTEVQQAVASLRTQLAQVTQAQEMLARTVAQLTTQRTRVRRDRAADPAHATSATPVSATSEDEVAQADAQVQTQIDLIEETMRAEASDLQWTDAAELSLQSVFQREESTGFHLVQAACRATLCRLELSLDGSVSPEESLRYLVHLMPWQGQAFVRSEDGEDAAVVMYLAREGHALPQTLE